MRDASDRLCLEYGLSVIQKPHKAPSRPVWIDEKNGEPTRYNVYREDLKAAFYNSKSVADAEHYLNRLGYVTDFSGKHWKLQLPQYTHFTRTDTLDESWTPEGLVQMLGSRTYLPEICFSPHTPHNMRDYYTPFRQTSHLYRLYIYFCFQLGIIPKNEYYEPKSPHLKEELRKLDSITAQMRYMEKYRIETVNDLLADRSQITGRLTELTAQRTKMQNRIRRASPEEKKEMQEEKTEITKKISALRKELKTNYDIESYAKEIQEKLDMVADSIDPSWRREVQKAMAQNNEKKERDYER